jgi:pimeloyl-ACP methyl ester carboxylesterase
MKGKDSPMPAHEAAEVLTPVLPHLQVIEFKGIGHMDPITQAAQINAVIVSFLSHRVFKT